MRERETKCKEMNKKGEKEMRKRDDERKRDEMQRDE